MHIGNIGAAAANVQKAIMTPDFLKIPGITAPLVPARTEFVTLPTTPAPADVPVYDVQEIVSTAKHIPWWQWMLGGVAAVVVAQHVFKR